MKNQTYGKLMQPMRYVLAISTILCGLMDLVYYGFDSDNGLHMASAIGSVVLMVFGIISLVLLRMKKNYVIALTSLGLGISLLLTFIEIFWKRYNGETHDTSFILMVTSFIMIIFGLLLIWSSVRLLMGHMRNLNRLAIYMILPIIMVLVIYLFLMFNRGMGFWDVYVKYHTLVPILILSIIFEVTVLQLKMLVPSPITKVRRDVDKLATTTYTSEMSAVKRSELLELIKILKSEGGWENNEADSDRYHMINVMDRKDVKQLRFRSIADTGIILVTIVPANSHSYINTTHFQYLDIHPLGGSFRDCGKVRIFGKDGFFADIMVTDDESNVVANELDEEATFFDALEKITVDSASTAIGANDKK